MAPIDAPAPPAVASTHFTARPRERFAGVPAHLDLGWVTALAERALRADAALLVGVDAGGEHVLAQHGLDREHDALGGLPLLAWLCRDVAARGTTDVVGDTARPQTRSGHAALAEPEVGSYAGAPVRGPDGRVLGVLCVLGWTPRNWSAEDVADLEALALLVRDAIDLAFRRSAGTRPRRRSDHRALCPPAPVARPSLSSPAGERIAGALAREQFTLHYQPIVDLASGGIAAYEGLLRWEDPEAGAIPPSTFLPMAERCGVMPELTRFVVRTACAQLERWTAAGLRMPIAINVSPREVLEPGFPQLIADELAGADPALLIVEFTEAAAGVDPRALARAGAALTDLGVRIALDDFGAEHCGLHRLRGVPVDVLKMDRRYMEGVPEDPRACAIVDAVIALGRAVGADVVAEGVENAEQHEFAREHGCRYGQGWYYGRPAAAADGPPPLRRSEPASSGT